MCVGVHKAPRVDVSEFSYACQVSNAENHSINGTAHSTPSPAPGHASQRPPLHAAACRTRTYKTLITATVLSRLLISFDTSPVMSVLTVCLLAWKSKKERNPNPNEMPADAGPCPSSSSSSRRGRARGYWLPEGTAGPRSHSLCLTSIRRIEVSLFTHAASAASVTAWGAYHTYRIWSRGRDGSRGRYGIIIAIRLAVMF